MLCLVTFAGFSCTPEDIPAEELLVGNWILTSKSIDNVPDTLSECALSSGIEFKANQICILNDACALKSINSGWSYRNGMLNISSHLPAAYYIEQLDGSVLRIRRSDITEAGKLQVTVFSYSKSID